MAKLVVILFSFRDKCLIARDPFETKGCSDDCADNLHHKNNRDCSVRKLLQFAELILRSSCVLENLGIVTSEDNNAVNEFGVTQAAASQHDVLGSERNLAA